ncbi:Tail fiber domain-containing protein [Gammaproteobacteria bacterium]
MRNIRPMLALVVVLAAVQFGVNAATVPNTFSSGTPAKSSEVNTNFSYLADRSWDKSGTGLSYSGGVSVGSDYSSTNQSDGNVAISGYISVGIPDPMKPSEPSSTGEYGLVVAKNMTTMLAGARFENTATSGNSPGGIDIKANNDPNARWRIQTGGTTGGFSSLYIWGGTSGSVIISDIGNVGIGTTSPSYPLHMGSGARVTTGGVWTNASSREYKKDINSLSLESAKTTLEQMNPVTFSYKNEPGETHVGFIAEDVPDLVATKDRKGLSPMDTLAVVTKVVQDQQKTIKAQDCQIQMQNEEIQALKLLLQQTVASLASVQQQVNYLSAANQQPIVNPIAYTEMAR